MYFVYIIECENKSLYTGITTDVVRRFNEHKGSKGKKGAKYTHAFKPKKIVACFTVKNKSEALKLEYKIKSLTRTEKLKLIKLYKDFVKKNNQDLIKVEKPF